MATYKIVPTPPQGDGHLFVGRYQVPVSDRWQQIDLSGEIIHVDSRAPYQVELWALTHSDESRRVPRYFRVFGTGHTLPADSRVSFIGTALTNSLVWHLFELYHGAPTGS